MRSSTAMALAAVTLTLAACGDDDESGTPPRSPGAAPAELPRGANREKAEGMIRRYLAAAASADREGTCAAVTPGYARSERSCAQEGLSRKDLAACADAPAVEGVPNPAARVPSVIGKGRPKAPYLALNTGRGVSSVVCWTSGEDFIRIMVAPDARVDMVSSGFDSKANASG